MLLKINIISVLLALPFAYTTELVFNNESKTYNVDEGQSILLICIPVSEYTTDIVGFTYNPITVLELVKSSEFNKQFKDIYEYNINRTGIPTRHILTMKEVDRQYTGYIFRCISGGKTTELSLNVRYPPDVFPICRTNYYTKNKNSSTIIQCTTETDSSNVYMKIHTNEHIQYSSNYIRNATHITQETILDNIIDISSIGCTTFHQPVCKHIEYSKYNNTCRFVLPL